MATNEDLAVAFLCLCDRQDKDEILALVESNEKRWDDKENLERIKKAIVLPVSMIQRKIALLHTGLYQCPFRKQIYEEMANRVANLSSSLRSPLIKPRSDASVVPNPREYIMPMSLNTDERA